jgi:HD-GYP domain-containing protein (c-di-GMP phosphodiesterase class II)
MGEHDELSVPMSDLINCFSDTIDLVSSSLADHHNQVGQVAYALACQLGLPEEDQIDLYFAGNLHDIGALSLTDRIRLHRFEGCEPLHHAEIGALLLETFTPLARVTELVRFHHVWWSDGAGEVHRGRQVPLGSHILHLADRISVLIGTMDRVNLLVRVPEIITKIENASGTVFSPIMVEAFCDLSVKESFWLGLAFPGRSQSLVQMAHLRTFELDTEGILGLSRTFARIIDFRSQFTATHSSGVAATAEALAQFCGWAEEQCSHIRIAGLLHDLGKLAIPAELLEKPAELSGMERALIRSHTYLTRRALGNIHALETITTWGADHHERIDGRGYPYHVAGSDLPLGSRIMAVSDVFTAITENRPYRAGMDHDLARKVLNDMVTQAALDPDIVGMLLKNFEELNVVRDEAQSEAVRECREINHKLGAMTVC